MSEPITTPDAAQTPATPAPSNDFAQQAAQRPPGFFAELGDFLLHGKKWWITPILIVLLVIGAMIVLGSTAAGPFLYTLF